MSGGDYVFPLYNCSEPEEHLFSELNNKKPNINEEIVTKFAEIIGKKWLSNEFMPENLFDYIYAVLHSPSYRTKYAEMLNKHYLVSPTLKILSNFSN